MVKRYGLLRIIILTMVVGLVVSLSSMSFAAGNAKRGKRKYNEFCSPCHGKLGKGDGTRAKLEKLDPQPRNHTDGTYMNKRTDVQLFKTIKEGGKSMNFSHIMPQWKHILKDKDIWNIVAFLRSIADPPYSGQPDPQDQKQ